MATRHRFATLLNCGASFCSLFGAVLLFFSLTIGPSPFRLVATRDGRTGICFDGKWVVAGFGGPLILSDESCVGWEQAKPAAVVAAERPKLVPWGFGLLTFGFVLQVGASLTAVR